MPEGMSGTEVVFWVSAVVGTLFFALRAALMVVGGFGAEIHDMDGAGGHDVPADAHHSGKLEATEAAFKLVSINSLTGFFMMFGWAGLSAHKQFGWAGGPSFLIGFVAGLVAMAATAYLFKMAGKLMSPGARFDLSQAAGLPATVYAQIPAQGKGQVQVTLGGSTRTVDALSEDGVELASFLNVKIVRAVDGRTVSVRR